MNSLVFSQIFLLILLCVLDISPKLSSELVLMYQWKTSSYGELRQNYWITWTCHGIPFRFSVFWRLLRLFWGMFLMLSSMCHDVHIVCSCHQLRDDMERQMSHLWVCWQVPCTLTFPAVVLQWVARLTLLAHHRWEKNTLRLFTESPKNCAQSYLSCSPPPHDLFPAACSFRPQLMM